MLTPHGVKLLDFGLASVARHSSLTKDEVAPHAFAGTIPYMSPEQLRSEDVDLRTDLYSLGVVLYKAATGSRPFEASTPRGYMRGDPQTLHPRPANQIVTDLPPQLHRVIRRALAKSREERYQSAIELGNDLTERVRAGSDASDVPVRRMRASTLTLAALAVALAVVLAYWLGDRSSPSPVPPRATVLVTDFTNTTNEPAFDGTLAQVLIGQLQQTPFLALFPEDGVRETLRLMARSPEERLTTDVALEVCRRRG